MKLWTHTTLAAGAVLLAGATLGAQAIINGAGATFPNPIYQKWFSEYNKLHSDVRINYQPVGSGGGIQQVSAGTVFFGATDGPMTDEQLLAATGKLLHFPTVLGGVVPIYNIPGVNAELKFTGPVLADIFLGKITKWNDPAIAKANAGVQLPNTDIVVVHRSEGSGHDVHPCRLPREGFAGMEEQGRRRRAAELAGRHRRQGQRRRHRAGEADARRDWLHRADLRADEQDQLRRRCRTRPASSSRRQPSRSPRRPRRPRRKMPADFRVSITNAAGDAAYPISSFTWLLLYEDPKDKAQAKVDGRSS